MLSHELTSICIWLERLADGEIEPSADGFRHFINLLGRTAEDVAALECQIVPTAARTPRDVLAGYSELTPATRGLVAVASSIPGSNVVLFPLTTRPRPPSHAGGGA